MSGIRSVGVTFSAALPGASTMSLMPRLNLTRALSPAAAFEFSSEPIRLCLRALLTDLLRPYPPPEVPPPAIARSSRRSWSSLFIFCRFFSSDSLISSTFSDTSFSRLLIFCFRSAWYFLIERTFCTRPSSGSRTFSSWFLTSVSVSSSAAAIPAPASRKPSAPAPVSATTAAQSAKSVRDTSENIVVCRLCERMKEADTLRRGERRRGAKASRSKC